MVAACPSILTNAGIDADHPAGFRRYLRERVEQQVKPAVFHYIEDDDATNG